MSEMIEGLGGKPVEITPDADMQRILVRLKAAKLLCSVDKQVDFEFCIVMAEAMLDEACYIWSKSNESADTPKTDD